MNQSRDQSRRSPDEIDLPNHNLDEIIAQLRQRIVELKSTLQFERAVQSKERTELLRQLSVIQKHGQEQRQASWQEQPEQQHLEIQRQMQLQQHKSSTMRLGQEQRQASWQEQPEQQHLEIESQLQLQQHKSSAMRLNLKSNQIDHLKAQLKAQKRRYQQLLRTTNIEISKERHKCLTLERRFQQLSALVEQLPSMIAHIEQSSQDIVNRIKHERDVLSP
jgi:hypothetical protein